LGGCENSEELIFIYNLQFTIYNLKSDIIFKCHNKKRCRLIVCSVFNYLYITDQSTNQPINQSTN